MGKRQNAPNGEAVSELERAAQRAIEAAGGDEISTLMQTHVVFAILGQAFAIIACAVSILYLWQQALLKKKLIDLPRLGCFVLHPGICPEYRNAHGCFWALAERDLDRVGMTLLKVDAGVDTGPVYGHYSYAFDERRESYNVIQYRVVSENLDALASRFGEIAAGTAQPIDTRGRASANWGQPWLTRYLGWRRAVAKATAR